MSIGHSINFGDVLILSYESEILYTVNSTHGVLMSFAAEYKQQPESISDVIPKSFFSPPVQYTVTNSRSGHDCRRAECQR